MRRLPLVLAMFVPTLAIAGDWPLHRGDATQTGVSTEMLPANLDIVWEFKTKNAIEGAPCVVDGTVYVGSADKHLYALDLKTGQPKWQTKVGIITSSPGVRGDRVYTGDADGKFHCLDRADGKLLWTFETEGQITAAPNFSGDRILIPSHDATLYCLDLNGKKLWDFKIEGQIYGGVAVVDGITFLAGCDSLLHLIEIKTGKELGNVDLKGQTGAAATVYGDHLYVGTMSNQVLAVNLKKLKVEWEFEAPRRKQAFYASPAVTDDLVVIGSRDNKVWAIDRKTGKEKWNFLTEHKVDGSAVIAGGRILVGSFDKTFYVLDMKGTKVASFDLDSAIMGSPAVADGRVIVGTDKGTVYCLGAK